MRELGNLTFETEIVKESSATSKPIVLGTAKNTMTLYKDGKDYYLIEWEYEFPNDSDSDDMESIGIYTENNTVVDYDGVFELPKEAIKLLRKHKIRVPRDFE